MVQSIRRYRNSLWNQIDHNDDMNYETYLSGGFQ